MSDLILSFYGDDFTGSTDLMEVLEWGGVPTVLFLDVPDAATLRTRFPQARAVGVAGISRTFSPAQMEAALPPAFAALRNLAAPFFHYKICSTFDSAPHIGSIGRATELGMEVFGARAVPMMVGAPALRRYVAFSNLFARVDDITYRLDRHPTMPHHPITPMRESDLRRHLAQQTALPILPMNLLHLEGPDPAAYFRQLLDGQDSAARIILFDSINEGHLHTIGGLLWEMRGEQPVLLVGSSGLEYALTHYWNTEGIIAKAAPPPDAGAVAQLIVISGSASPATAAQIAWGQANGFAGLRLDTADLVDPDSAPAARAAAIETALRWLGEGKNPLLYSVQGPDDPSIAATKARLERIGADLQTLGERLGTQQGLILREVLAQSGLRRACITGGDTCGYAARQLGIFALQALVPIAPGAPLCRAASTLPTMDGLEIALKAGQVGPPQYFQQILQGRGDSA